MTQITNTVTGYTNNVSRLNDKTFLYLHLPFFLQVSFPSLPLFNTLHYFSNSTDCHTGNNWQNKEFVSSEISPILSVYNEKLTKYSTTCFGDFPVVFDSFVFLQCAHYIHSSPSSDSCNILRTHFYTLHLEIFTCIDTAQPEK
jgi:hypothetical protein